MMGGVKMMAVGQMRVVARCFVIASFVMFGGFPMMVRRFLMMLGSLAMMLCAFV